MISNKKAEISIDKNKFKPKILVLVCNWHSFNGTESITDYNYPAIIKMIRVICTSRIDRAIILKAIETKIDGIIIIACNKEDCHYKDGNEWAKERINHTSRFLKNIGIEESRIKFFESDTSYEKSPIRAITTFSKQIKNLGPIQ